MGNESSTMNNSSKSANAAPINSSTRKVVTTQSPKVSSRCSKSPNLQRKPKKSLRKAKSLDSASKPLNDHDLDDIYAFILHMKKISIGENLLEQFLDKQSSNVEELDVVFEEMKKDDAFPIQSITIAPDDTSKASSQQRQAAVITA